MSVLTDEHDNISHGQRWRVLRQQKCSSTCEQRREKSKYQIVKIFVTGILFSKCEKLLLRFVSELKFDKKN